LRRPRSAWFEFWSVSGSALAQSLLLAWAVGSALALVALICWYFASASAPRHAPVRLLLAGAVAFGLFPGVLVGHAWMLTWTTVVEPILPGLRESWIAVFLAHLSRFAWIGVGLAWWLSRAEPRDLQDASVLAGGGSIRGFVRTRLSRRWTALLGVGLAGACLSLHEIEATISLQPPGTTSFAQTMLANLHFARSDELAVGSLVAGLGGTVLALLSGRLIGGGTARSPRQPGETLGEPAP
jgi:ABC-type Fe3+ transport system permease subunit